MLSKRPLTDRAIQALKPAPGVAYRLAWDAVVPGMAVRVTTTGQKSFVLVTRYPGSPNPTARSLGKAGVITLEDARAKAREWLKLIAAGTDPAQVCYRLRARYSSCHLLRILSKEWCQARTVEWVRAVLDTTRATDTWRASPSTTFVGRTS